MSHETRVQSPGVANERDGTVAVIIVVVVIGVALVSAGLAYGVWMVRSNIKATSARKRQRILNPPPNSRIPETAALELGNAFAKSGSCEPEPFVFPYFRPYNLAAYLPLPPPRVYVGGSVPFTPPGLPPRRVLDAAKTPVVVTNSAGGHPSLNVVFEHAGGYSSHQGQKAQAQLPPPPVPITDEVGPERTVKANDNPMPTMGLKLILGDAQGRADGQIVYHTVLTEAIEDTNIEGGMVPMEDLPASEPRSRLLTSRLTTSSQLPSPPVTPTLPTLVITSASIGGGLVAERGKLHTSSQLPSPPPTPTLVITSPSIHCGLNLVVEGHVGWEGDEDDLENWSDVLALEEYEDEDYSSLGNTSVSTIEQLPSPPPTPTRRFTPHSPTRPVLPPPPAKDEQWLYDERVVQAAYDEEEATDKEDKTAEPPLDHAVFLARLAAFTRAKALAKAAKTLTVNTPVACLMNASTASDASPAPTSSAGFDYERLLARKRAASPLANSPARTQGTLPVSLPVRCVARPRPLPGDFQPLLLRSVERSRLKSRA